MLPAAWRAHPWIRRYRAALVEAESYLLACQRYIELNPVRAHLARRPGDYPWSSYRAHAAGAADPLLTDHPLYLALGADDAARQKAWRAVPRRAAGGNGG